MQNFMENILKQFSFDIIQGLTIDLKDFLDSNESIKKYDIKTTEDKKYIINLQLTEFDKFKARNVFFALMKFIDYDTTFYTSKLESDNVKYHLLSKSIDEDLGFYFVITFKQAE